MFAALLLAAGVCLQPAQAQTGSAARLIQMNGQVSVMLGTAAKPLFVDDNISPQQTVITGPDGYAVFRVADGSTFEVFPNSKAVFRSTPGNWEDLLEMVLGKVRVEIQHLAGKPNPNKVRTPTAVISVRGTIFDVAVMDDKGTTLVMVEQGVVAVRNEMQPGEPIILKTGEWVEVDPDQPLAAKKPDYSALAQRFGRALREFADQIAMHRSGGGVPVGTSGGGSAADTCHGSGCKSGGSTDGSTGGGTTTVPPPPPPPPPPPQ
jgi:ferric-dicitrate binding protein FerR (iron transport regulator)